MNVGRRIGGRPVRLQYVGGTMEYLAAHGPATVPGIGRARYVSRQYTQSSPAKAVSAPRSSTSNRRQRSACSQRRQTRRRYVAFLAPAFFFALADFVADFADLADLADLAAGASSVSASIS